MWLFSPPLSRNLQIASFMSGGNGPLISGQRHRTEKHHGESAAATIPLP